MTQRFSQTTLRVVIAGVMRVLTPTTQAVLTLGLAVADILRRRRLQRRSGKNSQASVSENAEPSSWSELPKE